MALTFKHKPLFLLIFLFHHIIFFLPCLSLPTDSAALKNILLRFKSSLSNTEALLNWDGKSPPCNKENNTTLNWKGVFCSNGYIRGIQLPNMGLKGTVDLSLLVDLKEDLRSLNFADNSLQGPLPDLNIFGALKSAFLSNNQFSGTIPDDAFKGMGSLKKLHLDNNTFTGPIPKSLTNLANLIELKLQDNKFEGQIPDFQDPKLQVFNVSNNNLVGTIPPSLSKMDPSFFTGNKGLSQSSQATPTPADSGSDTKNPESESNTKNLESESKGTSTLTIVLAAVGSLLGLAIVVAILFILCRKQRRKTSLSIETPLPSNLQKKTGIRETDRPTKSSSEGSVGAGGSNRGKKAAESTKLSFVRDDREMFDLQDLLKASAEILGSGCFGSSYKAALPSGHMMVVKRFKQMNNVGREEFQEHMRRIGRLRHPNLLPLVSYYYRKEEKLLISDFVDRGSLAVHLHGYQALGQPSLEWATRLKVIKGVAKGLGYLYKELPSLIAPHGHMKSSNVLLNEAYEPFLTDYGLTPVINQESAQDLMVAYKSPEFLQQGRITKKTDVWGLGILILEILTGKFPSNFLQQGKQKTDVDLANWVNSVVESGDNNISQVFDKDMGGTNNSKGEMMKLLNIALACCEAEVEKRLDIKEAVEKIEELKERDGEDDFYSSCASEADIKSSRGKSDDFAFT
ncbi:hypothetical protein Dsin_000086 [Dipteronia sinensis]|uniref:non-specific serine/threonine protein kinase n=1 Tax=Dipteronia sinensis TaxID=43782 RepID=A0AAD9ZHK7_9ROSI|nr:hypothetical protein Dsin_000086 [Dipteronia sinensis]